MKPPVTSELRALRFRAHEVFDELWLSGGYTRDGAYLFITRLMGRDRHIHIGSMSTTDCLELIRVVESLSPEQKQDGYEELERTHLSFGRYAGKQYREFDLTELENLLNDMRGSAAARLTRYLDHPRTFAAHSGRRKKPARKMRRCVDERHKDERTGPHCRPNRSQARTARKILPHDQEAAQRAAEAA